MSFQNCVVLANWSGSSGIGLATARLFGELGAHVWLMRRGIACLDRCPGADTGTLHLPGPAMRRRSRRMSQTRLRSRAVNAVTEVRLPDIVVNSPASSIWLFQRTGPRHLPEMMQVNYFERRTSSRPSNSGMIRRGSGHRQRLLRGCLSAPFTATQPTARRSMPVRGLSDVLARRAQAARDPP